VCIHIYTLSVLSLWRLGLHSSIKPYVTVRVIKTNLMFYLSSVYFVSQPLHVSGIFVAHHQEVYSIYTTIGTCCALQLTVCWPAGWPTDSQLKSTTGTNCCTGVQLKSGHYFNMSNLFTKIYNMLYYTTNLYLQ